METPNKYKELCALKNEEWRGIKGLEEYYQVSNMGRVRSLDRTWVDSMGRTFFKKGRILKLSQNKKGYMRVDLSYKGKDKHYVVHRLVAETFIPNPQNKPCVDHIDTDKTNNKVENLRWCTVQENNYNETTRAKRSDTMKKKYEQGDLIMPRKSGGEHPDSIKVVQLTLEDEFVRVWDSIGRTVEGGFCHKHVCSCCKKKRKTHKGFKWMYLSEYEMNFNV